MKWERGNVGDVWQCCKSASSSAFFSPVATLNPSKACMPVPARTYNKHYHLHSQINLMARGLNINKTIKDGDISPWPLDHNCPYGHMERFDQIEWREHNNWLDHSYGEDRQVCASSAFTPSARRLYVWIRLHGIILCTISYLKDHYIKSKTPSTRLYQAVSGYTRL